MNIVFLMLSLFLEIAATTSLRLSEGFSKHLPTLAMFVFSVLSLTFLSFALNIKGFELGLVYAAWSGIGIAFITTIQILWKQQEKLNGKDIGPIGAMTRIGLGLGFVGSVVHGQLVTHLVPASWALGLIGFSALALAWHWWRIRRNPLPFQDTSPLSFVLSAAPPLALYFTWWYAAAFSVTSDATLIFVGFSMVLAGLRSYAGCELLAFSNWLLRRHDQVACAVFTPIDSLELRSSHP